MKTLIIAFVLCFFVTNANCMDDVVFNKYIDEVATNSKSIKESILVELSLEQLRIMRNTLFAKNGYIFKNKELASYFQSKYWYAPTNSKYFLEGDEKNVSDLILIYENTYDPKFSDFLELFETEILPVYLSGCKQTYIGSCSESKIRGHYSYKFHDGRGEDGNIRGGIRINLNNGNILLITSSEHLDYVTIIGFVYTPSGRIVSNFSFPLSNPYDENKSKKLYMNSDEIIVEKTYYFSGNYDNKENVKLESVTIKSFFFDKKNDLILKNESNHKVNTD
jgi:hypothetical protein